MRRNILCIDDMKTNLLALESIIKDIENVDYHIYTAMSAKEGIKILEKERIDIILLDIVMPEMDGFEAAKIIKSNERTKNIPIVFVTSKNDDVTIERCYDIGGVDYINKPFNTTELVNRIRFHLSLVDKEREIEKERFFVQNILDLQDNMLIVSDMQRALHVNNETLEFFGFTSLKEFQAAGMCINELFVREEGYFYIKDKYKNFWIDALITKLQSSDIVVKILKDEREYIFAIKASKLDELYVLSFTDISFISKQSEEYEHGANFDTLTQIYNRNKFHSVMEAKIARAKETQDSFIFIILDIDYFKQVNDTYGHLVGDEVLKSIASVIKKHIRKDDLFARWGGEEFVLSFNVTLERGIEIAENLRKSIELYTFDVAGHLTCSFGLSEYQNGEKLDDIILRADKALYAAKAAGRNRVCSA